MRWCRISTTIHTEAPSGSPFRRAIQKVFSSILRQGGTPPPAQVVGICVFSSGLSRCRCPTDDLLSNQLFPLQHTFRFFLAPPVRAAPTFPQKEILRPFLFEKARNEPQVPSSMRCKVGIVQVRVSPPPLQSHVWVGVLILKSQEVPKANRVPTRQDSPTMRVGK